MDDIRGGALSGIKSIKKAAKTGVGGVKHVAKAGAVVVGGVAGEVKDVAKSGVKGVKNVAGEVKGVAKVGVKGVKKGVKGGIKEIKRTSARIQVAQAVAKKDGEKEEGPFSLDDFYSDDEVELVDVEVEVDVDDDDDAKGKPQRVKRASDQEMLGWSFKQLDSSGDDSSDDDVINRASGKDNDEDESSSSAVFLEAKTPVSPISPLRTPKKFTKKIKAKSIGVTSDITKSPKKTKSPRRNSGSALVDIKKTKRDSGGALANKKKTKRERKSLLESKIEGGIDDSDIRGSVHSDGVLAKKRKKLNKSFASVSSKKKKKRVSSRADRKTKKEKDSKRTSETGLTEKKSATGDEDRTGTGADASEPTMQQDPKEEESTATDETTTSKAIETEQTKEKDTKVETTSTVGNFGKLATGLMKQTAGTVSQTAQKTANAVSQTAQKTTDAVKDVANKAADGLSHSSLHKIMELKNQKRQLEKTVSGSQTLMLLAKLKMAKSVEESPEAKKSEEGEQKPSARLSLQTVPKRNSAWTKLRASAHFVSMTQKQADFSRLFADEEEDDNVFVDGEGKDEIEVQKEAAKAAKEAKANAKAIDKRLAEIENMESALKKEKETVEKEKEVIAFERESLELQLDEEIQKNENMNLKIFELEQQVRDMQLMHDAGKDNDKDIEGKDDDSEPTDMSELQGENEHLKVQLERQKREYLVFLNEKEVEIKKLQDTIDRLQNEEDPEDITIVPGEKSRERLQGELLHAVTKLHDREALIQKQQKEVIETRNELAELREGVRIQEFKDEIATITAAKEELQKEKDEEILQLQKEKDAKILENEAKLAEKEETIAFFIAELAKLKQEMSEKEREFALGKPEPRASSWGGILGLMAEEAPEETKSFSFALNHRRSSDDMSIGSVSDSGSTGKDAPPETQEKEQAPEARSSWFGL